AALQGRVRDLVARATHPGAAQALAAVCTAGRLPLPYPAADPAALAELVDGGLVVLGDDDPPAVRPASRAVARVVRGDLGPGGLASTAERLLADARQAPTADRTRWRVLAGEDVDRGDLVAAAAECRNRGELLDAESLCR